MARGTGKRGSMHCNGSAWKLEERRAHSRSWFPHSLGKVMLLILVRAKLYETAGQSLRFPASASPY